MPVKPVIAMLVGSILLGSVMWQGCQATQATQRLPVHEFPLIERQLLSRDINPEAAQALQQIHTMDGVPDRYQTITVPTHTESQPVLEFTRVAITNRGGTSAKQCRYIHLCSLKAALPSEMAQELADLRHADFQIMQQWIDHQPTQPRWTGQETELVLTTIRFEEPQVQVWPVTGSHRGVTHIGFLTVVVTSILFLLLFAFSMYWIVIILDQQESIESRTAAK